LCIGYSNLFSVLKKMIQYMYIASVRNPLAYNASGRKIRSFRNKYNIYIYIYIYTQCVPLATEPGICLIILPLMRILQRNLKRTTDTFFFISHTTNVLLFKFRCSIFIGVRIIKEMPGSVASGTFCIYLNIYSCFVCSPTVDCLLSLPMAIIRFS